MFVCLFVFKNIIHNMSDYWWDWVKILVLKLHGKSSTHTYHHLMWIQYWHLSLLGQPKVKFSVSAKEGDLLQLIWKNKKTKSNQIKVIHLPLGARTQNYCCRSKRYHPFRPKRFWDNSHLGQLSPGQLPIRIISLAEYFFTKWIVQNCIWEFVFY